MKMEFDGLNRNTPGRSVSVRLGSNYKWKLQAFQKSKPLDMIELHKQNSLSDLLTRAETTDAWMFNRPSLYERRRRSASALSSISLFERTEEDKSCNNEKTELPKRYLNSLNNNRTKSKTRSKLSRPSLNTLEEISQSIQVNSMESQQNAGYGDNVVDEHRKDMLKALEWIQEELQQLKVKDRSLFRSFLQVGTAIHKLIGMDMSASCSITSQSNTSCDMDDNFIDENEDGSGYYNQNNNNNNNNTINNNNVENKNKNNNINNSNDNNNNNNENTGAIKLSIVNLARKTTCERLPSIEQNFFLSLDELTGVREEFV